jgi:hypothetical protein
MDDDLPATRHLQPRYREDDGGVRYRPHTLDMRREWLKAKAAADFPVLVAPMGARS